MLLKLPSVASERDLQALIRTRLPAGCRYRTLHRCLIASWRPEEDREARGPLTGNDYGPAYLRAVYALSRVIEQASGAPFAFVASLDRFLLLYCQGEDPCSARFYFVDRDPAVAAIFLKEEVPEEARERIYALLEADERTALLEALERSEIGHLASAVTFIEVDAPPTPEEFFNMVVASPYRDRIREELKALKEKALAGEHVVARALRALKRDKRSPRVSPEKRPGEEIAPAASRGAGVRGKGIRVAFALFLIAFAGALVFRIGALNRLLHRETRRPDTVTNPVRLQAERRAAAMRARSERLRLASLLAESLDEGVFLGDRLIAFLHTPPRANGREGAVRFTTVARVKGGYLAEGEVDWSRLRPGLPPRKAKPFYADSLRLREGKCTFYAGTLRDPRSDLVTLVEEIARFSPTGAAHAFIRGRHYVLTMCFSSSKGRKATNTTSAQAQAVTHGASSDLTPQPPQENYKPHLAPVYHPS